MKTLDEIASSVEVKQELKKTILLAMFKKLCVRMDEDIEYKRKIYRILRQSGDLRITVQALIGREYDCDISLAEAEIVSRWIDAYRKKKDMRKAIPIEKKKELYIAQKGNCAACGRKLGTDYSKIHVDHIIPWSLVGDELNDNLQDLCERCNKNKSARIDYMLTKMLNLS